MQLKSNYELPFKSSFDWRVGLFTTYMDLASESAKELIAKFKEGDSDLEWKDDEGLISFAFDNELFEKIHALVLKKAHESFI